MSKFLIVLLCAGLEPGFAATRLLRTPTVSATQIAFAYANNIWIVERAGGTARRLTSFQGQTTNPHFSPDGKWIAFSGEYAGNIDVYVVPAEGGEPKRLTWHPGADLGAGLDAATARASSSRRRARRGRRAPRPASGPCRRQGGVEEPLALPRGYQGKISAGRHAHRVPHEQLLGRGAPQLSRRAEPSRSGSSISRRYDLVSPPWTDSKDMDPAWVGDTVYFISDRDGVANVWSYDTKAKKLAAGHALHRLRREDARLPAPARVVFEQAGYVHELDPKTGKEHVVNITATGDFPWMMPQWEDVTGRMTNMALSPTGKRVAGRSARRDLHDSRREGRRAQPDPLERLGRARSGVVARRQVRFVFQRQVGRVQARDRSAGRPHAAARDRAAEPDALLHAVVVARLARRSSITDTNLKRLGARRRERHRRRSSATIRGWCPTRTMNPVWSPDSKWIAYVEPPELAVPRDLRRATSRPARRSR